MVILDKATAFADPENEGRILASFARLVQDKTVLVIAHRLSTITNADQILLVSLILLYFISRRAYFAAYKDGYEICADGRLAMVERLRKQPMGFYNTRDPGEIGAYIVSDYANVDQLLTHQLPQLCGGLADKIIVLDQGTVDQEGRP